MDSESVIKRDYIKSLKSCIKDCQGLIEKNKHIPGMERCVELSRLCIGACSECMDACESVRSGLGNMLQNCVEACKACAEECKTMAHQNLEQVDSQMKLG